MLVIDIGTALHLKLPISVAFQVLGENLLQVFVELLGILVFREMLFVVLDQFLDLLLELLIRDYVLSRVILRLVLVSHVLVEAYVAGVVWSLAH